MIAKSVLTVNRFNNFRRLIHLIAYPFLFGFLLDLSWFSQTLVSVAFLLATLIIKDFIDALLSLWQAIAFSGIIFLLFDYLSDVSLNQVLCALSIPVVWVGILLFKRKYSGDVVKDSTDRLTSEIVGVVSTGLLFLVVPRGQIQNLSFVGSGEDSAQYLMASTTLLRGQEFQLVTGFGASSFLFFYNFFNNGFLLLSKLSIDPEPNSLLIALNVLSNAWVFVLMSSIMLSIQIVSLILRKISTESANLSLFILISVSSFLFFRASQGVGHFTQYLLNCVVLVFLLSLIEIRRKATLFCKFGYFGFSFATALSLVGSYGPWLPMSFIGVALTINALVDQSLIRKSFNSKYLPLLVVIFVMGWIYMLKKLYVSSNLEMGGGVAVIPLEAVWLVCLLTVIIFGSLVIRRVRKFEVSAEVISKIVKFESTIVFVSATILLIAILDRTSFNQLATISFLVLIGLLFRPISDLNFARNFKTITLFKEFDGIFLLAASTFFYTFSIYLLSRFIGPIYDPMYAANKSMFAVFGQFSWLLILLFFVRSKLLSKFTRFTRDLTLSVSMLIVLGLSNFTRYDESQKQWWHEASLVALNENPDALIACVNPILTRDYESYKCNRFMNTLTSHGYFATSLMGVSLGDSSSGISDWFKGVGTNSGVKFGDETKVIVLSQDYLEAGARGIFEGVSENMLDLRVIRP